MATHETGVTNANVNNLILYIQTTRELYEQLQATYNGCLNGFQENLFYPLLWKAVKTYQREFPSDKLEGEDLTDNHYNTTFTAEQQKEFVNYYRSQFPEWLKEQA